MAARNVIHPRYLVVTTIAAFALVAAAQGLAGPPVAEPPLALSPQVQQLPIDKIEFESGHDVASATCGKCHEDIYNVWRESVHAGAFNDPIFQAGLAQAISMEGSEVAETCLTCHSPGTMLNAACARCRGAGA